MAGQDMVPVRVGFTGTQKGLTGRQRKSLLKALQDIRLIAQFHHGDCIGADEEAHQLVRGMNRSYTLYKEDSDLWHPSYRKHQIGSIPVIYLHPPTDSKKRAWCKADIIRPRKPYLERNREIVLETDLLIACPSTREEKKRSGTWMTVRTARRELRPIYYIYPDGGVEFTHGGSLPTGTTRAWEMMVASQEEET